MFKNQFFPQVGHRRNIFASNATHLPASYSRPWQVKEVFFFSDEAQVNMRQHF